MKKHHWHVFRHEKLFEKHPQPHCQTRFLKSTHNHTVKHALYSLNRSRHFAHKKKKRKREKRRRQPIRACMIRKGASQGGAMPHWHLQKQEELQLTVFFFFFSKKAGMNSFLRVKWPTGCRFNFENFSNFNKFSFCRVSYKYLQANDD